MGDNSQAQGPGGLDAFDKLPPALRKALAEFPLCMSAEFALEQIRQGTSAKTLIAKLADMKRNYEREGVKPL